MPEILIGEDNPADVYLIGLRCRSMGLTYSCTLLRRPKTSTVHRRAELLTESQLRLIILDLNLPCHDGIEILQRLRRSEPLAGVPVVVLTSSDSPRDRLAIRDLGIARFLQKPSNLDQFLSLGAVFKELLESSQPANCSVRKTS